MLALRTIRLAPVAVLVTALALALAVVAAPAAAQEGSAAPELLSAQLADPSITGGPVELRVRAAGRGAPVTGMVASFGGADGAFGTSSCLAADSSDGEPEPPLGPRSPVSLAAPHAFADARPRRVAVRLDSGGCESIGPSVVTPLTVTPNRAGEPARPVLIGAPLELPAPAPGTGPLPDLDSLPDPNSLPDLGPLPAPGPAPGPLPDLVDGIGLATAAAARRKPRCRGARRRPGRSRASRRRAARRTICLVNSQRHRRGLRPLRPNRRLARAARAHARSMVRRRYFSHVQPGGVGLARRLTRVSYISERRRWTVGENLGFGQGRYATPRQLVRAWMHSTAHRRAILLPGFRDLGVGVVHGTPVRKRRGITYAVNFGVSRR